MDTALPEPLLLHCIGGFVVSLFYGLPRPTGDIDYWTAIPANLDLDSLAGRDSALAREYGVYLQRVTVRNMPEEYDTRRHAAGVSDVGRLKTRIVADLILDRNPYAEIQYVG